MRLYYGRFMDRLGELRLLSEPMSREAKGRHWLQRFSGLGRMARFKTQWEGWFVDALRDWLTLDRTAFQVEVKVAILPMGSCLSWGRSERGRQSANCGRPCRIRSIGDPIDHGPSGWDWLFEHYFWLKRSGASKAEGRQDDYGKRHLHPSSKSVAMHGMASPGRSGDGPQISTNHAGDCAFVSPKMRAMVP